MVAGFILAELVQTQPRQRLLLGSMVVGGLLIMWFAASTGPVAVRFDPRNIWGTAMFRPPATVVLSMIGLFTLLVGLFIPFSRAFRAPQYGVLLSFSNGLLWIYLLHTVLGYRASVWLRDTVPFSSELVVAFTVAMLLFGWLVGVLATRILYSRRIMLRFARAL